MWVFRRRGFCWVYVCIFIWFGFLFMDIERCRLVGMVIGFLRIVFLVTFRC